MLNRYARGFFTRLFTPLARMLLGWGVTPDAVTILGTVGVAGGALVFYPLGQLFWGTVFITLFVFSDVLDGIMARMKGHSGPWGNFLDSTLDRLADGALFAGVAIWFFTGGQNPAIAIAALACLVLGMIVSYVRAKAGHGTDRPGPARGRPAGGPCHPRRRESGHGPPEGEGRPPSVVGDEAGVVEPLGCIEAGRARRVR
jgi:phosphatidylglycerophosphate synthase